MKKVTEINVLGKKFVHREAGNRDKLVDTRLFFKNTLKDTTLSIDRKDEC